MVGCSSPGTFHTNVLHSAIVTFNCHLMFIMLHSIPNNIHIVHFRILLLDSESNNVQPITIIGEFFLHYIQVDKEVREM